MGKKKGKRKSVSEVLSEPIDIKPDTTPSVGFVFGQAEPETVSDSISTPEYKCSISCGGCNPCLRDEEEVVEQEVVENVIVTHPSPLSSPSPSSSVVALPPSPEEEGRQPTPPTAPVTMTKQPRWEFSEMPMVTAVIELFKACEPVDMQIPDETDVQRALVAQNNMIRGMFFGKNIGQISLRNYPTVGLSKYNGPKQ